MADEQIHQDLGVDLGGGGRAPMNATEAAVRRSGTIETKQQAPPKFISDAERHAAEKDAALTPGERTRMAITKELASGTLTPEQHAAKLAELKRSLIAEETQEEQGAFASAPLQDQRSVFGLEAPDVPYDGFDEMYGGWEHRFLVNARNDGLGASTVRDIRDLGVKLGTEVALTGKPISDDVLDRELSKFGLTEGQRAGLKRYWRAIEGGGAG
jgi:hypothetical protein